jgi:hypothetical protein
VEAERKISATSTRPVNRSSSQTAGGPWKLIVAILVIAAVPVFAQAQPPSTAKVIKADAQKVIKIIRGDKAKAQTYCQIGKLSEQIE